MFARIVIEFVYFKDVNCSAFENILFIPRLLLAFSISGSNLWSLIRCTQEVNSAAESLLAITEPSCGSCGKQNANAELIMLILNTFMCQVYYSGGTIVCKSVIWMCRVIQSVRCVGIHIWQFTVVHISLQVEHFRVTARPVSPSVCVLWPSMHRSSSSNIPRQLDRVRSATHSRKTAIIIVAGAHFGRNGIQIWTINLATQINL